MPNAATTRYPTSPVRRPTLWLAGVAVLVALTAAAVACSGDSNDAAPTPTPEATSRPTSTVVPTNAPVRTVDVSGVVIIMRRGPCFGACPQYRLTIRGDGSFDFEGIADVGLAGTASDTMPPEDIQQLVARFDEVRFANLDDFYRCLASDVPTTVTSISQGSGDDKSVSRCALSSAPDSLAELEDLIDDLTDSQRWVERSE